jgi:release factor glutamine methyltransferase
MNDYRPSASGADLARIRAWHEVSYESMRTASDEVVDYLGLSIAVPQGVFPPTAVSDLLGNAVLAEVRDTDRVLDMGTGSGINAILAASRSTDVVAVDINPASVAAAAANAERNGVADRVSCRESDVFGAVDGHFDLMIFDPPFRWFAPRDMLERSMADENYGAMTRFVTSAADYLAPGGRILMFFGTSGDLDYLYRLIDENGFTRTIVASRELVKPEMTVWYYSLKLERDRRG